MGFFPSKGAGGNARAKTIAKSVALVSGEIYRLGAFSLKKPVSYAKTGGSSNLSINSATGAITATVALTAGQAQSLVGTATGADGVVVPLNVTLTGVGSVPLPQIAIPATASFVEGTNAGTLVFSIANVPAGQTPVISDSRLAIGGSEGAGWKAVVGLTSAAVGSFSATVSAPGAISASTTITVSEAVEPSYQKLGVNLVTPGLAKNDALSFIRGNEYPVGGGADAMRAPFVGNYSDGKFGIMAWPTGITQAFIQIMYNLVAGTSARFAITADGAGTPGNGGIFGINNAGGQISNIVYSSAGQPLRVEFDFTTPVGATDSAHFLIVNKNAGWSGADPIRNIQCRAIGPAAGAATMTGAPPLHTGTWNDDFVDLMVDAGYANVVRFMDYQSINYGACPTLTGETEWPGVGKQHNVAQDAYVIAGTGNSALAIRGIGYAGGNGGEGNLMQVQYANNLPYHGFGAGGNRLSLTIVAGSGTLGASFNKTNGEFTVTLASGGNTANDVITALQAYDPFRCMLQALKAPGSDGTGTVAPMARTYLHGGADLITDGERLKEAVDLTNKLNLQQPTIPWLHLPWHASAQHATDWANWVKANIDPTVPKIFVEVGNEVWNFGLPTYQHLNAWGAYHGYPGQLWDQGKAEYGAAMVRIGNALKAVFGSRVEVIAGVQLASNNDIMMSTPGFSDVVDALAVAPYFVPESSSFPGEANDLAWAMHAVTNIGGGIKSRLDYALQSKASAEAAGLRLHIYEFGQHDTSPYSADYVRRQRSPLMKKLTGVYLGECLRRVGIGSTITAAYYSMVSSIAGGASGAWGLQEDLFKTRAESPKLDAYLNAMDGIFPAYLDTTDANLSVTGRRGTGWSLKVRIPGMFNTVSAALKIYRDNALINTVAITPGPNAQIYTYAQTSADENKEIKFEIALVGTDGDANFLPYVTPPVPATWRELDAKFAWSPFDDLDTAAINPVAGVGALALNAGTAATIDGASGLWDFDGTTKYQGQLSSTAMMQRTPFLIAVTVDKDNDNGLNRKIFATGDGRFAWLRTTNTGAIQFYCFAGSEAAYTIAPSMPSGKHTYWIFFHGDGGSGTTGSTTVSYGYDQNVVGSGVFPFINNWIGATGEFGPTNMKYGPTQIVSRADLDLTESLVIVGIMQAVTKSDTTAPTITSANAVSVAEGSVLAHSLTANETVTWSLAGGPDDALVELSGATLRWAGNGTKDYEAPNDAGTNNVYDVIVRATDAAGNTTNQAIAVTVTNVIETFGERTFADMVGLGDSWVSGTGATPITNRWVDQLAAALGSSTPLNKGNAGTTISSRSGTIVGDATGANKRAGLIFALGFNDARVASIYWGWNGIASIYASARAAVQAYLAAGYAPTDILWCSPYYINDAGLLAGDQYQTSQSRAGFERHVAMHRSIAAEFGLYFFDAYAFLRDNGFPTTGGAGDNIHAGNTGHTMMKNGALLATVPATRTVPQCLVPPLFNQPFPAVGQAVGGDNGVWTDDPTSYEYRYKASGAIISGATASSYTPVAGDIGKTLAREVRATGPTGTSDWVVSETVTVTSAPVAASAPTVKGPILRPYFLKYSPGSSGFGQNRTAGWGEAVSNDLATPQAVLPSAPGWAMECKVRINGSGAQQGILGRWQKAFFWLSANGYLYATVATSGGAETPIGGGSLSTGVLFNLNDNVEHVIAMSASATSARVLVDGVIVGSLTATISTTAGAGRGFCVGNFNSNNTPLVNGAIEQPAAWNFDKYPANYTPSSTPLVGNEAGLIALWPLDGDPYGARV